MGTLADRLLRLLVVTQVPVPDYSTDLLLGIAEAPQAHAMPVGLRVDDAAWQAAALAGGPGETPTDVADTVSTEDTTPPQRQRTRTAAPGGEEEGVMATQRWRTRPPNLQTELAIALFGWQWRADWHWWCPPGWPSRDVIHPRYLDKLHALQRHGGAGYGSSGHLDPRGRPVIPDYRYDPEATEILWQWLHAQPGIQSVRFVPLPIPPDSLRGVRPWRCEIVMESDRVVTGDGDMHREALCYAVLALAQTQTAPMSSEETVP